MNNSQANDQRRWIISPVFDLCFLINVWWLLAFLPQSSLAAAQDTPVDFWQIYFLTTPHRWLTLILVSTDPDRRQGRTGVFLLMAIVAALGVLGVRLVAGAFTCLILADFIWNAWHFASQHSGILRIYGRMGGGGRPRLESRVFRLFITYVALRTAGWLTGWTEGVPMAASVMRSLDLVLLVPPALLLVLELINRPWERLGKVLYLASVIAMYSTLLWAIRNHLHTMVIPLAVASAAFHAVEYMAVVTYYAWRRRESGSQAPFRKMAQNWVRILALYMLLVGLLAQYSEHHFKEWYVGLNLWAAFLHYAYDGMIWKLRRSETAQTLGVELKQQATG